jgi:UDP-N-acetyl-D-galactosamine dehydrogenase
VSSFDIKNINIGVIGLGYVGLPLAVEFGRKYPTVGFDINAARVAELEGGSDSTLECSDEELAAAKKLTYSTDLDDIRDCNFYVVTVPTPIGDGNRPLLTPLRGASETLGKVLKQGDIVVYESTVYPGCTEEVCVPIMERLSGLVFNRDFYVGYSPERINPGDKEHRLPSILKVTSGSTPEVAEQLYISQKTVKNHLASIYQKLDARDRTQAVLQAVRMGIVHLD